jgi:hypothetical protein
VSGAQVEARVFGEDIVRRRFLRFSRAVSDASAAFGEVAGILRDATKENFAIVVEVGQPRAVWRLPSVERAAPRDSVPSARAAE